MTRAILGIDLGTRITAAVAVPLDWVGHWPLVATLTAGSPLHRDASDLDRVQRTADIAERVVAFARMHAPVIAYIESYGFAQHTAAHTLGELGGVVRLELVRAGVEIRTANMGSARKLLLGKVPRKDVKVAVFSALHAAGAPFGSLDLADAFVAANWGLSESGAFAFVQQAA